MIRLARLVGIGAALLAAVTVFRACFVVTVINGRSMEPTFENGDVVLVWRGAYGKSGPQRGDVLVSRYRGELIVKRVLGLPGEKVEMQRGELLVNDSVVQQNYPRLGGRTNVRKGWLGDDRFAVLGDNREHTIAAVIQRNQILGKVVTRLRLWPASLAVVR